MFKKGIKITKLYIISLTILLIFIILLLFNYRENLKLKYLLNSFNKQNEYQIVIDENKSMKRLELFTINHTVYYGYGIKDINVLYNDNLIPLNKLLETNKLSLKDVIDNFTLTENIDNEIIKYENAKVLMVLNNTVPYNQEILFIKK